MSFFTEWSVPYWSVGRPSRSISRGYNAHDAAGLCSHESCWLLYTINTLAKQRMPRSTFCRGSKIVFDLGVLQACVAMWQRSHRQGMGAPRQGWWPLRCPCWVGPPSWPPTASPPPWLCTHLQVSHDCSHHSVSGAWALCVARTCLISLHHVRKAMQGEHTIATPLHPSHWLES